MSDAKTKTAEPQTAPEVHVGVLVARPEKDALTRKREQRDKLVSMRDELFRESMGVLQDSMRFRDFPRGQNEEERDMDENFLTLVYQQGLSEATKTWRIAMASWSTAADAPIGLKLATNIAVGIMKANAAEKGGTHVLNVSKVVVNQAAIPQFEEREVENE
jgi:hypothetical protein